MNNQFNVGDTLKANNNSPLSGNSIAPPLIIGDEYTVKGITIDRKGNQHLDVGIPSEYNYIRSFETKEELPNGDKIHWCHPSRFKLS